MWEQDCGIVPVLNDEGSKVVGVVTDRDICMATWSRNLAPTNVLVSQAMSSDLAFCSPGDTLADAEATMRSRQIRRLPVLDADSKLVGILSIADITRLAGQGPIRGGAQVPAEQVVATLATIATSHAKANGDSRSLRQ